MPTVQFTVGDKLVGYQSRTVRNVHGSAQVACDTWLMGSLWGNPIELSPNNIHVYGLWLRDYSEVMVWFTREWIMVIKPLNDG